MNCTVISIFFGKRRSFPTNVKESISVLDSYIPYLQKLDSGTKSDLILVNHNCHKDDDPNQESLKYLSKINNLKTVNGKIRTITRPWEEGIGGSFKSFDYAFKHFKNDYNYWFFAEDDVKITESNYLLNCKKQFDELQDLNVAYICACAKYFGGCTPRGVRGKIISTEDDYPCDWYAGLHCHGGAGFTHKKYLNKIVKKYGHLPYCKSKTEDGKIPYRCFEVEGEVAFTNVYLKEGYKIALFNQEKYGPQPCPDVSGEYS